MSTPETKREDERFAGAPCYAPLHWSAEKPKRVGWWWVKDEYGAEIVLVINGTSELLFEIGDRCFSVEADKIWKWWAGPLVKPPDEPIVESEHNDQDQRPRLL